jgi:Tol biopolymer transport system component
MNDESNHSIIWDLSPSKTRYGTFNPPNFVGGVISLLMVLWLSGCGSQTVVTGTPASQSGNNFPTPILGQDGQITIVAPTANPADFSGIFFYVKENTLWQSAAPLQKDRLGGTPLIKVKDLEFIKNPALSPDAKMLAFTFSPEPKPDPVRGSVVTQQIILFDLSTKQTKLSIKASQNDSLLDEAAWSADGKAIYYSLRQPLRDKENVVIGQKLEIRRYEIATGKDEFVIEDGISPAASADGKSLVYIGKDATNQTLAPSLKMLDLNTRKVKTLVGQEQDFLGYYFARFSPDGTWVVFSAPVQVAAVPLTPKAEGSVRLFSVPKHSIPYDVYIVRADGTGLRRLTALYEDQPQPLWSKDGKKVIFLAGHGLYTFDIGANLLTKKVNEGAYGGFDYRE